MKNDVLTLAIVLFVVGVLASSIGMTGVFDEEERQGAPAALHQGVSFR